MTILTAKLKDCSDLFFNYENINIFFSVKLSNKMFKAYFQHTYAFNKLNCIKAVNLINVFI